MKNTATQTPDIELTASYLAALARWDSCKPPYTSTHMRICVAAAKVILAHTGKPRRSKYERANFLRMDFSKAGKVTFYAEFPKVMELKGKKLGEWPELALEVARENAHAMKAGGLRYESVSAVVGCYERDLEAKVQRHKLGESSYKTYLCRTKQVRLAFGEREEFSGVSYHKIIAVLDEWIATKSNNHALELFAELRRIWKFAAPQFCDGRNVAASVPDDYISSRVQLPTPTRLFTDIESIAQLWINVAACASTHQKNAVRFMILTGVRPININNLRWEYVNEAAGEIVYPAGITGMRGAMKTQKEFRVPITPGIKTILQDQADWRDAVPGCNREFVFLQPRDPTEAFSKRSLDKLVKDHSPDGAVKGVMHDGTIKGRKGAFNTMCRKFFKSNVIVQMRARGFSRSDTREISQICLHHSDKSLDPMAEHYDFSDEVLQEEMTLKRQAFGAHESSIMTQVALQRRKA